MKIDGAIISMEPSNYWKRSESIWLRCSKRNSYWHTYTNPWPGQFLTHAQSHITRALADSNLDPRAVLRKPVSTGVDNVADTCLSTHGRPYTLLGTIKIWNISKSMATNQSAWYSRLANESRTLAPRIGSIGHFRVPPASASKRG